MNNLIALFVFLTFPAATDPLVCTPEKTYKCSNTLDLCQKIFVSTYSYIWFVDENRTEFSRCSKNECDTFEVQVFVSDSFSIFVSDERGLFAKMSRGGSEYFEMTTLENEVYLSWGSCHGTA